MRFICKLFWWRKRRILASMLQEFARGEFQDGKIKWQSETRLILVLALETKHFKQLLLLFQI